MTLIAGVFAAVLTLARTGTDSVTGTGTAERPELVKVPSSVHVLASMFGAIGGYSTDTRSRSVSGYVTLSNGWHDYYTVGYSTLWLSRDDAGGKYFSQHLLTARGSRFLNDRICVAAHYAYLNEGEIPYFSNPAVFHWGGAGMSYWFSPFELAGGSFTLSLSDGKIVSGAYRGLFSLHVYDGIWATSTALVTDAEWTPRLFSFRESISIPIGNDSYVMASGEFGRRGFYFDDESLVPYNQRSVQTSTVLVKAIIQTFPAVFLIPSFEYNAFDDYIVKYGSLGVRIVF